MALEVRTKLFTQVNSQKRNGQFVETGRNTYVETSSKEWTDTVYRPEPIDLFGSSTARLVESINLRSTPFYYTSQNGSNSYDGGPVSRMFPPSYIKDRDYPTLGGTTWVAMENAIRNKLRGEGVNLAMALAEYGKTAKLFAEMAQIVATRGKHLAAAMKQRAGVSKSWLQFQYGVKPLTSDILQSVEDIRNAALRPLYIRGVESRRYAAVARGPDIPISSSTVSFKATTELHKVLRYRVAYRAKMSGAQLRSILTAHGFTNPFALSYNLIPYSFVIDWWCNLGDVLASIDNCLLFDKIEVVRSLSTTRGLYAYVANQERGSNVCGPGSMTRIHRTDDRGKCQEISKLNVLKYKPGLSATHIANGTALLRVAQARFR